MPSERDLPGGQFAAASRASADALPFRVVARSTDVGWTSLLVHETEWGGPGTVAFETRPTPDQWIALSAGGHHEVECLSGGVWRRAVKAPGSGGLSPGGMTDRLRVRVCGAEPMRLVHLYLPERTLLQTADAFRRAGTPTRTEPLNALSFTDPAVMHAARSLVHAMRAGAPDLYAQTVGLYLATHLLSCHSPWGDRSSDLPTPDVLTDRRLARVVEYLRAHYRESITLERLAAEAAISKFHFARLFRAATGEAPHRFLVRLRVDAARQLLRDTELPVAEVAAAVGYGSVAQFAAAFARHVGRTPRAFRATARGAPR
ncbi:AraC family transcriptional regulator [Gemmatimonadetes bacterium T265]|nr:AraC family transcriptional regulator [Gemmatimonadetes bacterium T265]